MKKLITTESGFTLIELMIVVAIIGILSVVAIPTFDGYQKKAKGTEAKISLSHVFTGEKSFQSEYGIFCSNLDAIGAINSNQKYYSVGFKTGTATGPTGITCNGTVSPINSSSTATGAPTPIVATKFAAVCTSTASAFLACAYAADNDVVDKDWSINENKDLLAITTANDHST